MVSNILVIFLLLFSAWRDITIRYIPNEAVLAVAVIGILCRSAAGWTPLLLSLATACVMFLVLLAFAMRGWLGGGDVKLAAALAVGLPPTATWDFVIATIFAGGLLGIGYLAGPRIAPRRRPTGTGRALNRILAVEAWRLRRGGPLPYGVAITVGGISVLVSSPGP